MHFYAYRYRWSQLRRYVDATEEWIQAQIDEFPLDKHERHQLLSDPLREIEFDVNFAEFKETTQTFPEILRRSSFTLACTILETTLNELCEDLFRMKSPQFSLKDVKGRGIERASLYIRRVSTCNPRTMPQWEEVKLLRKVRHILVHANGVISRDQVDQAGPRYVQSRSDAKWEVTGLDEESLVLALDADFCRSVVRLYAAFVEDLRGALKASLRNDPDVNGS